MRKASEGWEGAERANQVFDVFVVDGFVQLMNLVIWSSLLEPWNYRNCLGRKFWISPKTAFRLSIFGFIKYRTGHTAPYLMDIQHCLSGMVQCYATHRPKAILPSFTDHQNTPTLELLSHACLQYPKLFLNDFVITFPRFACSHVNQKNIKDHVVEIWHLDSSALWSHFLITVTRPLFTFASSDI